MVDRHVCGLTCRYQQVVIIADSLVCLGHIGKYSTYAVWMHNFERNSQAKPLKCNIAVDTVHG